MDRERDRDAVEQMIEDDDKKRGERTPERERPGQGDEGQKDVDSQDPPKE